MSTDRVNCPCGSGRLYPACCARFHMGTFKLRAPNPEALMRSRFSAYVMNDLTYLRDTWLPETRPASIEPTPPDLRWLGMQVEKVERVDDDNAVIQVVARYRVASRGMRMNETSRVRKIKGKWFYVDGDTE